MRYGDVTAVSKNEEGRMMTHLTRKNVEIFVLDDTAFMRFFRFKGTGYIKLGQVGFYQK